VNSNYKKKIAKLFFRNYSPTFERLNNNILFQDMVSNNTINISENKLLMKEAINERINTTIDYLEFGVFEGKSIREWLKLNTSKNSRFFGFDTFEGLPENWAETKMRGVFDLGGKEPEINDSRVQFFKGLFQETLPLFLDRFEPKNRIVIHMDADLYSSTLFCLTKLDKILTKNTIIIFDEFSNLNHEFRALYDYTRSFYKKYSVINATKYWEQVAIIIR
jgi:hypothetical protein